MSTVELFEREAFAFGSDAMVERLLTLVAEHENTHGGIVLYGYATMRETCTARSAVHANDSMSEDVRGELLQAFGWPGSFWLRGEPSAVLVESLVDYAESDTTCGDEPGMHRDHVAELCDCDRRHVARVWVCEIAHANGLEIADAPEGVTWA